MKFGDAVKGMVGRMQAFEHPENDILGDENRELLK